MGTGAGLLDSRSDSSSPLRMFSATSGFCSRYHRSSTVMGNGKRPSKYPCSTKCCLADWASPAAMACAMSGFRSRYQSSFTSMPASSSRSAPSRSTIR